MQQVADEFEVHLDSVENWRRRWDAFGLVGLFEGRHTGRPPKLSGEELQWESAEHTPLSRNSIKEHLKAWRFAASVNSRIRYRALSCSTMQTSTAAKRWN